MFEESNTVGAPSVITPCAPIVKLPIAPGGERLSLRAGDLPGGQRDRGVRRQLTEFARVPQLEGLHCAVLHVGAHVVRRPQARQQHLALVLRPVQVLRGRLDPDRGRRDDPLQVRVLLQQPLRLLERHLRVVVAVGDLHQLHVRELRLLQLVLHVADPRVLIRRRLRRRQDRDLPGVVQLLAQQVDLAAPQILGAGLGDEHLPAPGIGVRVVGDHLDPRAHRLLQRRAQRAGILRGHGDRRHVLLHQGIDVRHLPGGVRGAGGPDLLVALTERGQRGVAAGVGDVEVRVVDLLGQEADRQTLLRRGVRVRRPALPRGRGAGRRLVGRALGGPAARAQTQRQQAARGQGRDGP